jgi:squamous cell carcinoma antigen recognized by T-cells 3
MDRDARGLRHDASRLYAVVMNLADVSTQAERTEQLTYSEHECLLDALQSDRDALKSARERFADQFPLAPTVWKDWLSDEINYSSSIADRAHIANRMFPRALEDYLSVDLSEMLIRFQGNRLHAREIDVEEFRRSFEDLVGPGGAGLHYLHGIRIWRAYRFELSKEAVSLEDQTILLARQLSVALRGNEEESTHELFPTVVQNAAAVSAITEHCEVLDSFESKLTNAGSNPSDFTGVRPIELTQQYAAYASCEEERDMTSACIIWERCVAECFLDPSAWLMYDDYLRRCGQSLAGRLDVRSQRGPGREALVLRRAVRNVSWSMQLWTALVSSVSKNKTSRSKTEELQEIVHRAAPNVFQSEDTYGAEQLSIRIVVYASQLRSECLKIQQCRSIVDTALSFNIAGGPSWAVVETVAAKLEPDIKTRQEMLENVVARRPQEARWWIHLAEEEIERAARRAIYHRAVKEMLSPDQLDLLAQAWLLLEVRQSSQSPSNGMEATISLTNSWGFEGDSFDAAMDAIYARRNEISGKDKFQSSSRVGLQLKRSNPVPIKPRRKRNKPADFEYSSKTDRAVNPNANTARNPDQVSTDLPSITIKKHSNGAHNKSGQDDLSVTRKAKNMDSDVCHVPSVPYESGVIYVNNLPFSVTEDAIHHAFASAGKIHDVRLPRRKDGALKGFAYVEFEDDSSVDAALALDKMDISGREVWVRRSKPPKPRVSQNLSVKVAGTRDDTLSKSRTGEPETNDGHVRQSFQPGSKAPPSGPKASLNRVDTASGDMGMTVEGNDLKATADIAAHPKLSQSDFRAMFARK